MTDQPGLQKNIPDFGTQKLREEITKVQTDLSAFGKQLAKLTVRLDKLEGAYARRFPDFVSSNCPFCGRIVPKEAKKCQHCGREFGK